MIAKFAGRLLLLPVFLSLAAYPLASPDYAHSQNGEDKSAQRTLRIGGLLALTGGAAQFSLDIQQGIQLAIPELEKEYGIKIELLAEDTRMETGPSVTAYKHLSGNKGIGYFFILGSGPVLAIKNLREKTKPFISTSAAHQDVLEGTGSIIRHSNSSEHDGRELAQYLAGKLKIQTARILTLENEWSVGYSQALMSSLDSLGISHSEETFRGDDADFRSLILKAKNASPGAVVLSTFGPSLLELMRTAKELQLDAPIVANIGFAITEGSQKTAQTLDLPSFHYQTTPAIPAEFWEKFRARFGREPAGYWSVAAYTDTELMADAFANTSGEPPDALKYAKSLGRFRGTFESVDIGEDGDILIRTHTKPWSSH